MPGNQSIKSKLKLVTFHCLGPHYNNHQLRNNFPGGINELLSLLISLLKILPKNYITKLDTIVVLCILKKVFQGIEDGNNVEALMKQGYEFISSNIS